MAGPPGSPVACAAGPPKTQKQAALNETCRSVEGTRRLPRFVAIYLFAARLLDRTNPAIGGAIACRRLLVFLSQRKKRRFGTSRVSISKSDRLGGCYTLHTLSTLPPVHPNTAPQHTGLVYLATVYVSLTLTLTRLFTHSRQSAGPFSSDNTIHISSSPDLTFRPDLDLVC